MFYVFRNCESRLHRTLARRCSSRVKMQRQCSKLRILLSSAWYPGLVRLDDCRDGRGFAARAAAARCGDPHHFPSFQTSPSLPGRRRSTPRDGGSAGMSEEGVKMRRSKATVRTNAVAFRMSRLSALAELRPFAAAQNLAVQKKEDAVALALHGAKEPQRPQDKSFCLHDSNQEFWVQLRGPRFWKFPSQVLE